MAITWSPLHAALGADPRPLDYADIVAAVEANMEEQAGLEFKGYRRTDEAFKNELAKDLAALANSGGGLLVFGIGEVGEGEEKRRVASPVLLVDQAPQQVLSVAYARVQPLITGIEIQSVPSPTDPGRGALLVRVPPSPDAPHFIEGREPDSLCVPWRDGPHTRFMRERQVERAYRERFGRHDRAADLLELRDSEARHLVDARLQPWLVVTAIPRITSAGNAAPVTRDRANAVVESARVPRRLWSIAGQPDGPAPDWLPESNANPRRGYRRWVWRTEDDELNIEGLTRRAYLEGHLDGGSVAALPVGGAQDVAAAAHPSQPWLETALLCSASFAHAWALERGVVGDLQIRASIVPAEGAIPVRLTDLERVGPWRLGDGSDQKRGTVPVRRLVPAFALLELDDPARMYEDVLEVALDLINQFGATSTVVIRSEQ